MSTVSLHSAN